MFKGDESVTFTTAVPDAQVTEKVIDALAPFGVTKEVATTLALLWFATQLAVSLMGGIAYLTEKKPATASEEDEVETPRKLAA